LFSCVISRLFLTADISFASFDKKAVLQVASSTDNARIVLHDGLISAVCRNISYYDEDLVTSRNALQSLVYLSSHGTLASQCIADLIEAKATSRLFEVLLTNPPDDSKNDQNWRAVINFGMALLANLTRTEEAAIELLGRTLPDEAVKKVSEDETARVKPTMELLLSRFLSAQYVKDGEDTGGNREWETDGTDPYQHFASVLQNATQVEKGRNFLVKLHYTTNKQDPTTLLQDLLPQLRSSNPIRRRGVAGVLRNCAMDKDSSWWLLNVVQITPHLLYPLAGPEELDVDEKRGLHPDLWLEGPDKVREPDHWTRLFLVETILILCATGRASREKLRLDRVYVILKWADMVEEHEDVSEIINECVQYLRRDEEGTDEGSSDRFVANFYAKASLGAVEAKVDKGDYDAVD
jgi:hypothetical protein